MNKIICLWSCPRNVSTALMYSFAQRDDTCVFDEPLYAHYLKISGAKHPGREKVLKSLDNNGNKVVQEIILQKNKKILFHKLMTHFLINIDTKFLELVTNILFIRDPKYIVNSYSKIIPNPTIDDVGIKKQYKLYIDLEKRGRLPIVLDSKCLLKNPELFLKKLCFLLEIPFNIKMLKWKKGGIIEDGVWAKYWYRNIHNSTGFIKYTRENIKLQNSHEALVKECLPYYNFLKDKSMQL